MKNRTIKSIAAALLTIAALATGHVAVAAATTVTVCFSPPSSFGFIILLTAKTAAAARTTATIIGIVFFIISCFSFSRYALSTWRANCVFVLFFK